MYQRDGLKYQRLRGPAYRSKAHQHARNASKGSPSGPSGRSRLGRARAPGQEDQRRQARAGPDSGSPWYTPASKPSSPLALTRARQSDCQKANSAGRLIWGQEGQR